MSLSRRQVDHEPRARVPVGGSRTRAASQKHVQARPRPPPPLPTSSPRAQPPKALPPSYSPNCPRDSNRTLRLSPRDSGRRPPLPRPGRNGARTQDRAEQRGERRLPQGTYPRRVPSCAGGQQLRLPRSPLSRREAHAHADARAHTDAHAHADADADTRQRLLTESTSGTAQLWFPDACGRPPSPGNASCSISVKNPPEPNESPLETTRPGAGAPVLTLPVAQGIKHLLLPFALFRAPFRSHCESPSYTDYSRWDASLLPKENPVSLSRTRPPTATLADGRTVPGTRLLSKQSPTRNVRMTAPGRPNGTRRPAREGSPPAEGASRPGREPDAGLFGQSSAPAAGAGAVSPSAARPPRATAGPHATPQTRPSGHRLPYMLRPRRRRPQTPPRGSDRGRMWHDPQQGASAP